MPRIAISGSFGTGKTTLLEALEVPYPKLKETARDVITKTKINPRYIQNDLEAKFKFQEAILDLQIKKESENKDFLIDRSIFDSFGFCGNLTDIQRFKLYKKIRENYNPYDLVIFLPSTIPLVDDGTRLLSPQFQKEVEKEILLCFEREGVSFLFVTEKDFITRKNKIQKLINKL